MKFEAEKFLSTLANLTPQQILETVELLGPCQAAVILHQQLSEIQQHLIPLKPFLPQNTGQ